METQFKLPIKDLFVRDWLWTYMNLDGIVANDIKH